VGPAGERRSVWNTPTYLDLVERYNAAVSALHWAVYGLRCGLISAVENRAEDVAQLLRVHFEDGITALHREYAAEHASVDNPPSNAVCRKAGFELLGETEFEYPPGRLMRSNDWRIDLTARA
jgi:hypothetical protein